MTSRRASESSLSPSAVDPSRSEKTIVTVLRTSCTGTGAESGVPQNPHRRKRSGFSSPQFGQISTLSSVARWALYVEELSRFWPSVRMVPMVDTPAGRGRASYAKAEWGAAYEALLESDRTAPLAGEDLELLSIAAYMLGREDEWMQILERACREHSDAGELLRAARCAFWIGVNLALHGEMGPASGWLGRAQRFVEAYGSDCAEQGYMLIPVSFQHEASGDLEGAIATAAAAVEIGERFHDADLLALALHVEGQYLVQTTRVREGLARLDEAMVAVTTGELSPIATGIVYCGVILACEDVFELRRAREWTAVLTRWCEEQSDLIAFTGRCPVHRPPLRRRAICAVRSTGFAASSGPVNMRTTRRADSASIRSPGWRSCASPK